MSVALPLVALALTVLVGTEVAHRLKVSAPLLLTVVGVVASFLPIVPQVQLSSELVLVGLLPPLLFAAAIGTSLVDFRANIQAIGFLSVAMVVVTALSVGVVIWAIFPVPFTSAFALGAVVGPPDAVAATSIGRRIGLPRRLVTLLEGESLVNDATALVLLRTATVAITGTAGSVTAGYVTVSFLESLVGGLVVGVVVAAVLGQVHQRVESPVVNTALSFVTPYLAYLPAEKIHGSGVLAVVVAGLLIAHNAPVQQTASGRLQARINWSTVQFLLENVVFLLIGLQAARIVRDAGVSALGGGVATLLCFATLAVVLLTRPMWIFLVRFPATWLDWRQLGSHTPPKNALILSWAGMRGVVTLAAAFALPAQTASREVLILAAMVVTAGTLLLQGSTLPALTRRLDVRGPDPREDALQEARILQVAANAGLAELDRLGAGADGGTVEQLRTRLERRVNAAWERLGPTQAELETPSEAYRRLRLQMLAAERRAVLEIRDAGSADHEVLDDVMGALDLEESMLDRAEDRNERLSSPVTVPEDSRGDCEHLQSAPRHAAPRTPEGCEECLARGMTWVHLRLCLACGHVGCCDSSEGRHASQHYEETGHPVMRSFEAGERWRWCFVDELMD
ncbi:MAG TPA: Na+/H+ antiporter [Segeticoccus sp.]|uniref:Na+/H+ antiporter n=1 Tax=Segeticoccus sp. TaxID=2706531 RepID=UPI002D7FCCA1|nr:Na+/H+ antiporter [Segeticoccus sp.]HET8602108.1 Na+/H+ antiporter [Segeticoccus sp.]